MKPTPVISRQTLQTPSEESVRRSIIKPYLVNVSGSGFTFNEIIIERNIERPDSEGDGASVKSSKHAIVVHARNPATLECTINGGRKTALFSEGDAIISPVGLFTAPRWSAEIEILLLAINPSLMNRVAEEMNGSGDIELIPKFHFRDELLVCLVNGLVAEFERDAPPDSLYAESLIHALTAHLVKKYSARSVKFAPVKGGLPPRKLARVVEYIRERLDAELALEAIAAAADISPSHFMMLFKQTTGLSPHQYVLSLRIEKAKELLRRTNLPVAEIAAQTGFADQSHLTRVMRRRTGLTPKLIRESADAPERKFVRIF